MRDHNVCNRTLFRGIDLSTTSSIGILFIAMEHKSPYIFEFSIDYTDYKDITVLVSLFTSTNLNIPSEEHTRRPGAMLAGSIPNNSTV